MKKFFIGMAAGIVFAGLALAVLAFALVKLGARKPQVTAGSTLVLRLEGDVPEKAPPDLPLPFLESRNPPTVAALWLTLRKAAADPRIRAVLFEPRGLEMGWARLEEIRAGLQRFRASGKPLTAYLRNPGIREYYLATAAGRITMAPEDSLDVRGLSIEAMYLKNTLDKFGLKMEVVHAGAYKDAYDMFTRTAMTPQTREVLNAILDRFYGDVVAVIAEGRKKTPAEVRAIIDEAPLPAQEALKNGLIDETGFDDSAAAGLAKTLGQKELTKISLPDYLKVPASDVSGVTGPSRIALVVGAGPIVRSGTGDGFSDNHLLAANSFVQTLRGVADDPSIKGVILRVDSPGGDGVASDDILHEAKRLSHKKPLVVSMGDVAASGGYFISMTGDPIVAYPNTLTGSIGVIYGRLNLRGLYGKLGIETELLSRGRYASLNSSSTDLTPEQESKIGAEIDRFYRAFLQRVAEGRRKPVAEIEPLAQGRVWLGAQAQANGLVNDLGGLDRAIALVKRRAGIGERENITLVTYPPRKSWIEILMNRSGGSDSVSAKLTQALGGFPVEAWLQGGYLKIMPIAIRVR